MSIGEANKLNYAAAVATLKALKDEEEARQKTEQDGLNKAHHDETLTVAATSAAEGEPQDSTRSPDDAKGQCNCISIIVFIIFIHHEW